MPTQDSSLDSIRGREKSPRASLADSINSAAEKDTRKKPWESTHQDGQATVEDGSQEHSAKLEKKDEYWMSEGSVNASS